MFKLLRSCKDAYITDRIVNGIAAVSGNTGKAGTLDLFKLYGVTTTTVSGSSVPNTELSRLLTQFDLNPLRAMVAAGQVDPSNPSFSCKLHLFDVYGGQPTPNNFTVSIFPLSASFDEGLGSDVVFYSDQDVCNWTSGSLATGSWFVTGCGLGNISTAPCDYITQLSGGLSMQFQQVFVTGLEDLYVDITPIVSATLAGLLPDVGLRISFSSLLEANQYTYFVKRFASRHAFNTDKAPVIEVRFDDSIQDDTKDCYLDATNYLFLYNYNRSSLTNLTSGSSVIEGKDCLELMLDSDFPSSVPGLISSSICLLPQGAFGFADGSDVLFSGSYQYLTGDIVYQSPGPFTFVESFVAFTGEISGSLGSQQLDDVLLSGTVTGIYTMPVTYGVLSGVFFNDAGPANGVIVDNTGAAFTGSVFLAPGNTIVGTYALYGVFTPAYTGPNLPPLPYVFSASYVNSASFIVTETTASQVIGGVVGEYVTTLPNYVPSGSFTLPDGVTPALFGTALLTGSTPKIDGMVFPSASIMMTGSFVPDGTFVFSASYIVSATYGPVDFSIGPFTASQLFLGANPQTGIYSASVFIPSTDPDIVTQWQYSGSVTFTPVWRSLDGTFPYLTGSALVVNAPQRGSQTLAPKRFEVTVLGVRDNFGCDEQTVLRVNIFDYTLPYVMSVVRLPVEMPGVIIRDVHYQIRDVATGRILVPFDTVTNSTRLSNDSAGMYFRLDTSNLTPKRSYSIDIMIVTGNNQQLYKSASPAFRVDDVS